MSSHQASMDDSFAFELNFAVAWIEKLKLEGKFYIFWENLLFEGLLKLSFASSRLVEFFAWEVESHIEK